MQRNYKLIISIIALAIASTGLGAFSQSEAEYKDVILDGKPAKLNVATGEITLINALNKIKTSKTAEDYKTEVNYTENPSDYHIVKEKETLLDISRKYNVPLTKLKQLNNLESTLINKGQKLQVSNFNAKTVSEPLSDAHSTQKSDSDIETTNYHLVEKDETLYSLSRRYKLSVSELKRLNGLSLNLIVVGQKLRISDLETETESKLDNISVWTVEKDDTLYSIALKTNTSVAMIKQLNGLTSNLIVVGQELRLK